MTMMITIIHIADVVAKVGRGVALNYQTVAMDPFKKPFLD